MRLRGALLLALWLGALAGPAAAQDIRFSTETLEACFASGRPAGVCVGASAQACMADSAGGTTTVGMVDCFNAELAYWDAALNQAYGVLRAQLAEQDAAASGGTAPSQVDALRAMQRAWIAFRDARCGYERSLWGGGSGGGPAGVACAMAETARQALYLEEQLGFD